MSMFSKCLAIKWRKHFEQQRKRISHLSGQIWNLYYILSSVKVCLKEILQLPRVQENKWCSTACSTLLVLCTSYIFLAFLRPHSCLFSGNCSHASHALLINHAALYLCNTCITVLTKNRNALSISKTWHYNISTQLHTLDFALHL